MLELLLLWLAVEQLLPLQQPELHDETWLAFPLVSVCLIAVEVCWQVQNVRVVLDQSSEVDSCGVIDLHTFSPNRRPNQSRSLSYSSPFVHRELVNRSSPSSCTFLSLWYVSHLPCQ